MCKPFVPCESAQIRSIKFRALKFEENCAIPQRNQTRDKIAGMSLSYKSQAATGPRIIPADVYRALDNCHWMVPNPSFTPG